MTKKKAKNAKKRGKKEQATTEQERLFLARVYVALKPTVNDPEGITIGNALGSLGFDGVRGVDRKSTRLNSSHSDRSRMPSSA